MLPVLAVPPAHRCRAHCQPQRPPLPAAPATPAAEGRPARHSPQAASRSAHTVATLLRCCSRADLGSLLLPPGDRAVLQTRAEAQCLQFPAAAIPLACCAPLPAPPLPSNCCPPRVLQAGQRGCRFVEHERRENVALLQGRRQLDNELRYERGRCDWQVHRGKQERLRKARCAQAAAAPVA